MRAGNYATNIALAGATVAVFAFIYQFRLFDISMSSPWAWAAIVVLDDFAYYWFHRFSHECRFWWAAHVNHHSSQQYNLSTAIRQPWTGVLVGTWAPWFVLLLIGFPPEMIFLQSGLNLLYQFWIHTEAIRRMPAGSNTCSTRPRTIACTTRRTRGTSTATTPASSWSGTACSARSQAERDDDPPKYGLINNIDTYNPFRIAFHEWAAMFRDVRRARSLREVFGYVFGPPGWRPDGTGPTAANVRAAWARDAGSAAQLQNSAAL